MKKNRESFVSEYFKSIKDFDSYKDVSQKKISDAFKYFSILILIYAIVATIGITHSTKETMQSAQNYVQTELNNFTYTNGTLSVNEDEYSSYYNNEVIIDTSVTEIEKYDAKVIFGKLGFKINISGNNFVFKYSDFVAQNINKQDIIELLDFKRHMVAIILLSFTMSYIVLSISTLLDILIIALIGFIISTIIGNNKVRFKNAFNISTHAITLSVTLAMIYFLLNKFTGFDIKYFSTMYTSVATIYMVTSVILINTEKK